MEKSVLKARPVATEIRRLLAVVVVLALIGVIVVALTAGSSKASTPPTPRRLAVAQYVADQIDASKPPLTHQSLEAVLKTVHDHFGNNPAYNVSWGQRDANSPWPIEVHVGQATACVLPDVRPAVVLDGSCPQPVG